MQIRGGGTRFKEVAGRYVSLDLSMGLAMGTSMDMTTQRKVKLKLTNKIEKSKNKSKQTNLKKNWGQHPLVHRLAWKLEIVQVCKAAWFCGSLSFTREISCMYWKPLPHVWFGSGLLVSKEAFAAL